MRTITLPDIYADHRSKRGLPMGEVVSMGRKGWVIRVDDATLRDIVGDAKTYGFGKVSMAPDNVVRSAMRAYRSLIGQGAAL